MTQIELSTHLEGYRRDLDVLVETFTDTVQAVAEDAAAEDASAKRMLFSYQKTLNQLQVTLISLRKAHGMVEDLDPTYLT